MGITGVQVLSPPVRDQDLAKAFSVDVLGLELVADESMAPGSTKGTVLETDDLDGDLVRLRDLGVEIPVRPSQLRGDGI